MLFYKLYHTKVVDIEQYKNLPLLSNTIRYYMMLNTEVEKSEIIQVLHILLDHNCDPYVNDNTFIYDIISCQDIEIFDSIMSRLIHESASKFDINMLMYSLLFNSEYISNFFIKNVHVDDDTKQINIMYRLMVKKYTSSLQYCLESGYAVSSNKTNDVIKYFSKTIDEYLLKIKSTVNSKDYIHKDIVDYSLTSYLV